MPAFKVVPPYAKGKSSAVIGGPGERSRTLLGRLTEVGPSKHLWLDLDREHVVAVFGKRGSGKTHTLGVLVEGLSTSVDDPTHLRRRHAIVVFDTLNLFQWIDLPLDSAKGLEAETQRAHLKKWGLKAATIEPTFWHPIGCEPANKKSNAFSINPEDLEPQDWAMLLNIDVIAEPMGQLLTEVMQKIKLTSKSGGTKRIRGIDGMLSTLRDDQNIQSDYAPETIRALRQRLSSYARSPLFDVSRPDWTSALKPGQLSIFLLGRVPEDMRSLLVFLVIRRLLETRSAASELTKQALLTGAESSFHEIVPPTWLVIDEAQNILPSRNTSIANDILTRFVREGRNFGLSLAVTTQQPSSIDARVLAQVDTLIAHNLTVKNDINYVLSNLKGSEPDRIQLQSKLISLADTIRQLDPGQSMISAVDAERLLFCEIRPRTTLHGGFEI